MGFRAVQYSALGTFAELGSRQCRHFNIPDFIRELGGFTYA